MATWLDAVVQQLQTPGGAAALSFVEANYTTLLALDMASVREILTLFGTNQRQAALVKLETKLTDPAVIVAYETQNAGDCAAREKAWETFKSGMENFALTLLPVVVKVAETVATGGLAI